MQWKSLAVAASAACSLAACGGGGGSTPTAPANSPAQGVYQGTTSSGYSFDAIVLEDNSIWAIYGTRLNGGLSVTGLFNGSGEATNGSFSEITEDFPAPGNAPIQGSFSGTYVPGSSVSGTISEGGRNITVNGTVPVAATYDYNTPAALTTVTGSWNGSLLDGETASITVSSTGNITGTSSGGCSFTGFFSPRASGKNVFDVTIQFGATPCVAAGQTASGIGIAYPVSNNLTQLVAGLVTSSGALGTAFFAQR